MTKFGDKLLSSESRGWTRLMSPPAWGMTASETGPSCQRGWRDAQAPTRNTSARAPEVLITASGNTGDLPVQLGTRRKAISHKGVSR